MKLCQGRSLLALAQDTQSNHTCVRMTHEGITEVCSLPTIAYTGQTFPTFIYSSLGPLYIIKAPSQWGQGHAIRPHVQYD